MTKLETISNNHMSLECHCGHRKLVSVKELISKLSPSATIYEVARKAKCSHYDTIGVACFLVFVLLLAVFIEDGPDEEIKERHKWCDKYHPNLTYAECSNEVGR